MFLEAESCLILVEMSGYHRLQGGTRQGDPSSLLSCFQNFDLNEISKNAVFTEKYILEYSEVSLGNANIRTNFFSCSRRYGQKDYEINKILTQKF